MNKQSIKLAEITLLELNNKSWNSIKLDEIYKKSKINKKYIQKRITSKFDLLKNINRYFDLQLTSTLEIVDQSSHKDMIFEVMMMRFDILQNYRKSIIRVFDALKRKPQELLLLIPSFIESMVVITRMAKIPISGLKGNLKIKGLLVIYFLSFLVWTKDNCESLEKTMKSLDNYLNNADSLLSILNK